LNLAHTIEESQGHISGLGPRNQEYLMRMARRTLGNYWAKPGEARLGYAVWEWRETLLTPAQVVKLEKRADKMRLRTQAL